jgi:hypothetical protein
VRFTLGMAASWFGHESEGSSIMVSKMGRGKPVQSRKRLLSAVCLAMSMSNSILIRPGNSGMAPMKLLSDV